MVSRLVLLLASLSLALPSAAAAQMSVTAAPNDAGSVAHLKIAIDGSAAPFANRLPRGLVLSLARGYGIDMDAATACSQSNASGGACQPSSQVASGTAVLEASFAGAPGSEVTANLSVFRTQDKPAGSIGGLVAVIEAQGQEGTARGGVYALPGGEFGHEVRFEQLAPPPAPAGVTVRLKRIDLDIGATRREPVVFTRSVRCKRSSKSRLCKRRSGCRRGRRCPRYRAVRRVKSLRRDLLRNPSTCTGAWPARAVATFEDGSSATVEAAIACVS